MRRLPHHPLCVALDAADGNELERLAEAVAPHAGVLKVGLTAFNANGGDLVRSLAARRDVFLDLKLHDIPAQTEGAAAAVADLGASYLTVHAAGGEAMVKAAVAAAGETTVLAVTVLTSLDDRDLHAIGLRGPADEAVVRLAALALDAGAPGLVCSALEVARLRREFGAEPLLVVPGVRPEGSAPGDQRRTLSPGAAMAAGADVVVVGRPITSAADPGRAAAAVAAEVGG